MANEELNQRSSWFSGRRIDFAVMGIIACIAAGCASAPIPPPATDHWISLPVKFKDALTSADLPGEHPHVVAFTLGALPGEVFVANVHHGLTIEFRIRDGRALLDVDALSRVVAAQARPFSWSGSREGLRIEPASTRFARILALATRKDVRSPVVAASFVDPSTQNFLAPVYFDRPCRLRGHISGRTSHGALQVNDFDVIIPRPGIAWLEFVRSPVTGGFEVKEALTSVNPTLIVWLPSH
ncbi:MAG TPA: hypothetical protein VND80_11640 [Steroidobacteraceae bacterium]|nr:hypothetical protein [Steroidobacteraceae bacterium]